MEYLEKFTHLILLDKIDTIPILVPLKNKFGLKPSILTVLLVVGLMLVSFIINVSPFVTAIVCYLIPAYLSFMALESKEQDDDIRYLNYWIIFSLIEVSNPIFRLIFNKTFYMLFRVTLTILLLHPLTNLSVRLYNFAVKPFLEQHEKSIDQNLKKALEKGKEQIINGVSEGLKKIS